MASQFTSPKRDPTLEIEIMERDKQMQDEKK